MSELIDKQVNVQTEGLKKPSASSRKPTKKCVMKMKQTKKNNDCPSKKFLQKEGLVYV